MPEPRPSTVAGGPLRAPRALVKAWYEIRLRPHAHEPDGVRKVKALNVTLVIVLAICIVELGVTTTLFFAGTGEPGEFQHVLALILVLSGVSALMYVINNRVSNTLASIAFMTFVMVLILVGDSIENVTQGRSLIFWTFPVVLASILASPRGSIITASIISGLLVVIPAILGEVPPIYAIGLLLLTACLIWFLTASLRRSLAATRANESNLERAREGHVRLIDQLIKVSRFKSDFMATMSHELRTPLNAIIGFSELLDDEFYGTLSGDQREFLQNILSSSEHLLELVNQFLDIARIESGKIAKSIRPVVLNDLVGELVAGMKPIASSKGVFLIVEGLDEQRIILADPLILKRILTNLVSNGIKYTQRGTVTVQFTEKERWYELSVIDTGVGIAGEDHHRVFKEFERIGDRDGATEGTGLGLAITKRLVALHGGEITFASQPGTGTTFTFTLPKPTGGYEGTTRASTGGDGREPEAVTVLIIEDDKHDMDVIEATLREIKSFRFTIHAAPNLATGIDILTHRDDVQLVLLDLLLPETEGMATVQAILELGVRVPIIIVTVVEDTILASESIKRGVQDYLVKNEVTPATLEKTIRLAMARFEVAGHPPSGITAPARQP